MLKLSPLRLPRMGGHRSQLAVLPGTTHVTLAERAEWLASMITAFLEAPTPETT
jgi:hypothetical protein